MERKTVHPHARGERIGRPQKERSEDGSSPRPWGTRPRAGHPGPVGRFIPTPVGNATCQQERLTASAVHPHARGERTAAQPGAGSVNGSSPRPWGTPASRGRGTDQDRFIPTPVGNAACRRSCPAGATVHPHARGERERLAPGSYAVSGSSPRPWGTQQAPHDLALFRRFIPTPVGNAARRKATRAGLAVHPHARGERQRRVRALKPEHGSSPRPWGTHRTERFRQSLSRFIPTPVGNANCPRRCKCGASVHPHARGERVAGRHCGHADSGSSPRPWGTHRARKRLPRAARFIPTPVGNAH